MKLKTYTVEKWCEIFGVQIHDNDGFKRVELNQTEIGLDRFLDGINVCTINIVNIEKYKILDYLLKVV